VNRPVRIRFSDIGEHRHGDLFIRWLVPYFHATGVPWEFSDPPDVLFVGFNGVDYRRYDCPRVILSGENVHPNFDEFDFALGNDLLNDSRYLRVPFGHRNFPRLDVLTAKPKPGDIARDRTQFCNFVYSNPHPRERIRMFRLLSRYRKVDSFGPVLNNMPFEPHTGERFAPDWPEVKRQLQARYKFTIAFESESWPGYVTEKICDAMEAGSVPIYWGSPCIADDFNTRSFINCHDYPSFEKVVERIVAIDQDESLYLRMLGEPWFRDNRVPDQFAPERLQSFLRDIFLRCREILPVARQPEALARASGMPSPGETIRQRYGPWQRWYRQRRYVRWPARVNQVRRAMRGIRQGDWSRIRDRLSKRFGRQAD
jgi:hypothetical protein